MLAVVRQVDTGKRLAQVLLIEPAASVRMLSYSPVVFVLFITLYEILFAVLLGLRHFLLLLRDVFLDRNDNFCCITRIAFVWRTTI